MIEQDGYAGVKNLHQMGDGGWTGNATANGKPVTVMVSPAGSVRTHNHCAVWRRAEARRQRRASFYLYSYS